MVSLSFVEYFICYLEFFLQFLKLHDNMILMFDVNLILTSEKIKVNCHVGGGYGAGVGIEIRG